MRSFQFAAFPHQIDNGQSIIVEMFFCGVRNKSHQLFALVLLVQAVQASFLYEDFVSVDDQRAWNDYKRQYGKIYTSPQEEYRRRQIFFDNKHYVESFDTKETGEGFVTGINSLSDLSTEEINRSRNGFRPPESLINEISRNVLLKELLSALNQTSEEKSNFDSKERAWYDELNRPSLDFRYQGIVSRVKDQGSCGSCWAFATTGALESALAMQGRKILLSEQQLVDCSQSYGNNGCMGGLMDAAFRYIRDHGIMSARNYPYEARDGKCKARSNLSITSVRGSMTLPRGNESLLRLALILRGPIPVAIDAGHRSFHNYKSGVYNERRCKSNLRSLNHAVLLIGYGTESGREYWLLKNSWGRDWGDNGYFKLARNKNNACGVATYAVLPRL